MKIRDSKVARKKRHQRLRQKVVGTQERPRISFHRSLKHMYIQLIDDLNGQSLLSCSSQGKDFREKYAEKKNNKKTAATLGEIVADKAIAKGIKKVVFDRGGYRYHRRVKELADAARKKGLQF